MIIYLLFQYSYGDILGGFDDLVHVTTDLNQLLSYNKGEIWLLDTSIEGNHPQAVCDWRGSDLYEREYTWYKHGTWEKFDVKSTQ